MIRILPGAGLALLLALFGHYLAELIGVRWMGLARSPVSPIMMAILLGILLRNTLGLSAVFQPGVRFCLVRILRIGIVLLGIRLSLGEAGAIGLRALPVIVVCVAAALLLVTWISKRLGMSARLGTLIAAGTGICGATAIVALSPTIEARDDETSYAVACITLFGVAAMLAYPFLAHALFNGDGFAAGLFLGTSVHETAQVAGAGMVYQQYFSDPQALDTATVAKLVRNLGMLIVIPLLGFLYHRQHAVSGDKRSWVSMVPLFVIGFALMSLLRTVGDAGEQAFGVLDQDQWSNVVSVTKQAAEICLAVAMAAVGLG
ncbi:MAG: putative sulfate exporter family transporter, partial [Xanthomonadales bacterium]|nr:putative sulfate exporter family transporter [Gammaproteobacteria bacterium]NNL96507.1 putative sulfate exporter family transporter [Xanthomonadales bacterium]